MVTPVESEEYMADNFWIGSNELVIIYKSGRHYVLEAYEDYEPVFDGDYEKCRKYCEMRKVEYIESII